MIAKTDGFFELKPSQAGTANRRPAEREPQPGLAPVRLEIV